MNEEVIIDIESTIKDALRQLNNSGEKCLVVVGDEEKYTVRDLLPGVFTQSHMD